MCYSWAQIWCMDPVDIWLTAPVENLTEFPAMLKKEKEKQKQRKMPLITEQGCAFWPHSSSLSMTRTNKVNLSIFQTAASVLLWLNNSFVYADHVSTYQVQMCGPVSTFGPSDTVTTGNLRDRFQSHTISVCSCTLAPRITQPHRAAERGPVSLPID